MSVLFYPDDAGFVGQSRRFTECADDVAEAARGVQSRLDALYRHCDDLMGVAEIKVEAVDEDPAGYTVAHVQNWRAVEGKLAEIEAAMLALGQMLRGA